MNVVKYVKDVMCEPHGHELLYLCKFGSSLYGTNTPDSDVDYKGIFLPSKKSILVGNRTRSLTYNTGNNNSRNTKDDIDINLWSLQYFFELLGKGETNSIDLVYSKSNPECVMYYDTGLKEVFNSPLNFFNPVRCDAFISYSISQAKRYGIRGSRLGVIKNVYEYMENLVPFEPGSKLSNIVEGILDKFYDDSFCFCKEINGEEALVLCGKVHLFSIRLDEFYYRVKREYEKYGERAKKAEQNEGVDWKALSHAFRCLLQYEELLNTGKINYPLQEAHFLLDVKQGKYDFTLIEKWINEGIERVKSIQEVSETKGKKDQKLIEQIILNLYGE